MNKQRTSNAGIYSITTTLLRFITAGIIFALFTISSGADETPDCLTLTFEEAFDADNTAHGIPAGWKTSYIWGNDIAINNELQYYLQPDKNQPSPFRIRQGVLSIIARPLSSHLRDTLPAGRQFTSGLISTENLFAQKYGRFEIRAKMPQGRGLWPAFWLLPKFDQWPEGIAVLPEIDVVEFLGHQPTTLHTTVHSNQSGSLKSRAHEHQSKTDLTAAFHDYAVDWDATEIRWYLDGKQLAVEATPRDLRQPMYLLINLAVGGNWPGKPDANTRFPAHFMIDRVRVYQIDAKCRRRQRK